MFPPLSPEIAERQRRPGKWGTNMLEGEQDGRKEGCGRRLRVGGFGGGRSTTGHQCTYEAKLRPHPQQSLCWLSS
eukprot:754809-Hanusia_phi.AAC.7